MFTIYKVKEDKMKQSKRKSTYSLKSGNKRLLNTPHKWIAEFVGQNLIDHKSVSMVDNETQRVVGKWIYGRKQ